MRSLDKYRLRLGHSWKFALGGLLACLNISCTLKHSTDGHKSPASLTDKRKPAEIVSRREKDEESSKELKLTFERELAIVWPCLRRHLTPEEQDRFDAINTQSIFENVDEAFYAAALRKQGSVGIALGTSEVIALLSDAVAIDYYAQEPGSFFGEYVAWLAKGPGSDVKPLELAGWTNTWIAEDPEFKKAAARVRRGQFYFVLAHELGHIIHGHNLAGVSSEERVMMENEADDFAIRMVEAEVADPAPRSAAGVPAGGAHVWLLAHSMMTSRKPNEEIATHTPSLSRMQRVASQLSKSPHISSSESATFSRLSANLDEIAKDPAEAERQRRSAIATVTKDHLRRFVPARPPAASIIP